MYPHVRAVIRAHYVSTYTHACVGPPEWADKWVSTEEKVSHMGASVPCNTSPTDGGDIRAADVQMKLTDWLRLNRLHILLRLRRTTSGERPENGGFVRPSNYFVDTSPVRESHTLLVLSTSLMRAMRKESEDSGKGRKGRLRSSSYLKKILISHKNLVLSFSSDYSSRYIQSIRLRTFF